MQNRDILYTQLLQSIREAVIVTKLSGEIIYWNRGAEKLYKWTADEVLGKNIVDVTPSKMSKKQANEIMKLLKKGQEWNGEFEVTDKEGRVFNANVSNTPLKNEQDELIGIIGVSRDISATKKAKQAFNESETRFRVLYEYSPDAIILANRKSGIIVDANKAAEELFETKLNIIIGRHQSDLHPPQESQNAMHSFMHKPKNNGIAPPVEIDIITEKQNRKTVEIRGQIIKINEEEFVLGTFRDITARKTIEKLLKESEERFRTIASSSPIGVYLTDKDGKCTYANPRWLKMAGMSLEEALGTGWENAIHPDDRNWVHEQWYKRVRSNGKWHFQYRFINKQDEISWVDGIANAIYNDTNTITGYVGINTDITEQRKAQAALKESEDRLKHAQSVSKIGDWVIDIKNNKLDWSEETYKIFGINPGSKLTYDDFLNCVHPEDKKFTDEAWNTALKTGIYNIEHRIFVNDKIKWIHEIAEFKYNEKKELIYCIGTAQDITERKIAEIALKESEERFRLMFKRHHAVMLIIDPQTGNIKDANSAAEKFYGYAYDILCSMNINEINTLSSSKIEEQRKMAIHEKKNFFEFNHKLANGDICPVEVHSSPIEMEGEELLFSIISDISERKKAEKELENYRQNLEVLVKKRTQELEEKNKELETYNQLFVGREFRIKELKEKIKELEKKLNQNN